MLYYIDTLIVESTDTLKYYTILYNINTRIVEATNTLENYAILVEATDTLEYRTNIAEEVPFAVVKINWTLSNRLKGIENKLFTTYWRQTFPNGTLSMETINKKCIPRVAANVALSQRDVILMRSRYSQLIRSKIHVSHKHI